MRKWVPKSQPALTVNATAVEDLEVETTSPSVEQDTHQFVTTNVKGLTRNEKLEGRDYLVVPMVMLTEGVHAGSNGPLYYPKNELSKTPAMWNHKPVVVYHPTQNGSAISACEPAVISRRKVGLIMNTRFEAGKGKLPGRLKAEAWLETNALQRVDGRVLKAILNKQMVEVSTGLFTDNEQTDGTWNNEQYVAIARNYRADHLAILPDEKGACSIADGAGLLRNTRKTHNWKTTGEPMKSRKQLVNALIANQNTHWEEEDRETLNEMEPDILEKMIPITTNAGKVSLAGPSGKNDGGADTASDGKGDDNSETVCGGDKMIKPKKMGSKSGATDNKDKGKKADEEEPDEDDMERNSRSEAGEMSMDEYIANAPPAMRDILEQSVQIHGAQKTKLVRGLVANKACKFTTEQLMAKSLGELQLLTQLAAPVTPPKRFTANYAGLGDVGEEAQADHVEEEPLEVPVMNFSKRED